jgi:hypothetical protein
VIRHRFWPTVLMVLLLVGVVSLWAGTRGKSLFITETDQGRLYQGTYTLQIAFSHATDCSANVTTARVGQMCIDLDDNKLWVCDNPGTGGNTTYCDSSAEWAGIRAIVANELQCATPPCNIVLDAATGQKISLQINSTEYAKVEAGLISFPNNSRSIYRCL